MKYSSILKIVVERLLKLSCFVLVLIIICFTASGTLYAQGKYAADFLRIGIGARAVGMGGSFVALADDGTAGFWNSAGLYQMSRIQVNFGHVDLFSGLAQHNFACVAVPLAHYTAVSATWIRMGAENIPRYSALQGSRFDRLRDPDLRSTGVPEGHFSDTEDAILFSVGRGFDFNLAFGSGLLPAVVPAKVAFGVTLKYIRQSLDVSVATAQGIDIGVMLKLHSNSLVGSEFQRCVTFGANLQDISRTTLKWNTSSRHHDTLPFAPIFGIAYAEQLPWAKSQIIVTAHRSTRFGEETNWGCEYRLGHLLSLRAGLQSADLTFGAGIRILRFQLDYAFVGYELGNTHRISASLML